MMKSHNPTVAFGAVSIGILILFFDPGGLTYLFLLQPEALS
jgi:hypothetical protein